MLNPTDLDPPNRVYHLNPIFAISGWLIENENRFCISFSIIVYGHPLTRDEI